ncbi:hypothetical protein BRDID11002_22670 [Bradyrhizobium diazoefficiens]
MPGVNNRFLDSLVKGEIENFGSHFQDGPYGDSSIGDEKARWEVFKDLPQPVCLQEVQSNEIPAALYSQKAGMCA